MSKKNALIDRREVLVEVGQLLHGEFEWMTKFAATIGVSKQLMAAMVDGGRTVSDRTWEKVRVALCDEAKKLKKDAARLNEIEARVTARKGS